MFGYVSPQKSELKLREFSEYKAAYCSLCRSLRGLGFGAKFFVNYDFVFAAMLFISLSGEMPSLCRARCNTNPLEKVGYLCGGDAALDYCAAALVVTVRYKLRDDRADEGFFRRAAAVFLLLLLRGAYHRAKKKLPEFDDTLARAMCAQQATENAESDSADEACDPSAGALRFLFERAPGVSEDSRALLGGFGYMLGRYVYLTDALDDLSVDLRRGRYNPFVYKYRLKRDGDDATINAIHQAQEDIRASLRATQAAAESRYRLLAPMCFRPILDNIVYLGLLDTVRQLPRERKKKGNEA
ncbi:MAG: DUF5685 family protein [Oscillospiraceae bacterium]|nr:DUF5685 family protein [Oscillospiraceae bacterium]